MADNFETVWAKRLSYSNSFDNPIDIYLEPEAQGVGMTFSATFSMSKYPQIIA